MNISGGFHHETLVGGNHRVRGFWDCDGVAAKGPAFTVTLNKIRTVENAHDSKSPEGRIAPQYGAGVVKFRKVEIRPLHGDDRH
ncbi:MAG: hypothetical protein JOZ94_28995 [Xanthobacteraceae bacterium]|nr:hypothetical protein [Xanthobacteraceae bacterium]MBV9627524.1 hypothetical protein [Xanthobacteraceae bacterium]